MSRLWKPLCSLIILFIIMANCYVFSRDIFITSKQMPNVLLWGGAGQLGTIIGNAFNTRGWTTWSVDFRKSDSATHSIELSFTENIKHNVAFALEKLHAAKAEFEAVICVAGGWAGGNISHLDVFDSYNKMDTMNIQSALAAGHAASKTLKEGGFLLLTGAAAGLGATPGMIAYGISKAATHHLVSSLAQPESGLPKNTTVAAVLPIILDTATNRKDMPTANFADWTPLETVAGAVVDWSEGKGRPKNGALVKLVTKAGHTEFVNVN